jgi:pyruvate/oxaloacetate carboxyltransferase
MREASAVHANALGDLIYSLACGHEVQYIARGVWGYTPAMIARELATRQVRLDLPQRCYRCADQERKTGL